MTRDNSGQISGQIRDVRDVPSCPGSDGRDKPLYKGLSLSRVRGGTPAEKAAFLGKTQTKWVGVQHG